MGVRLGEVPEGDLAHRVELLGQQPSRPGQVDVAVEELTCVFEASDRDERLDEPRRAQQESALAARNTVVVAIPEHDLALAQDALHSEHGRDDSRVVRRQHARERDLEDPGVDVGVAVAGRERADLRVPALAQDLFLDLRPGLDPFLRRRSSGARGDRDATIDRGPTHHLRDHEVAGGSPLLPDPVVRLAPAATHRIDDGPSELPMSIGEVHARAAQAVHEIDDGTEHVELQLVLGQVADAHRS